MVEFFIDGIVESWLWLMTRIVPEKRLSQKAATVLKIIATGFSVLLLLTAVIGILAVLSDDPLTKNVGRYLIMIPLLLSATQILVGVWTRKKKGHL